MAEQNEKNKEPQNTQTVTGNFEPELDAAGKSLAQALKISFVFLKMIMVVLVVLFLASGFRTVSSDEQALVLRFGKIRGAAERRILKPGLHWVLPYPIDELVKIPVAKKINLPINSFWYYQKPSEMLPDGPKKTSSIPSSLNPVYDGYCITRSRKQDDSTPVMSEGNDYNIVHCKWQLTYKIDDPERFFRNVYVTAINPGQSYFDAVIRSVTPLLKALVEDTVVTTMVNYTIDQAVLSPDRIPQDVERLLQKKLDRIQSGIKIISVQLTDVTWPRQVNRAFLASIQASQTEQRTINQAQTYAEKTLNETAGPVASELLKAVKNEDVSEQRKSLLWKQLAGQAQQKIAQARAYRTKVVESARADADYLHQILPEYRKRPRLVIQKIYQDAIQQVFDTVDEKIVIQPAEGNKPREIRVLLNRDPVLKSKSTGQ